MKTTFFDALAISDSEKIHTQTIAWILSLGNDIFPTNDKLTFLKILFDIPDLSIDDFFVDTEVNKIDLFINTNNFNVVIENKLKSSEHGGQTNRYINYIPNVFKKSNVENKFIFLTLTNDVSVNQKWTSVSYETLSRELKKINWNRDLREYIFISEYIYTLENLVNTFNLFDENHKGFPNVFLEGSRKKIGKKVKEKANQEYVRKNQLETIFQKYFFKKLLIQSKVEKFSIQETHGNALVQVSIRKIKINKDHFNLGFQFQRNTLKINLSAQDYRKSKKSDLDLKYINVFREEFHNENGYKRFNKPKTRAYWSVSKKLVKEVFQYSVDELSILIKKEIDYTVSKSSELQAKIDLI